MRGYGAGIDPITPGHFPFRDKLCMFIGDYDMFPVKIEVILDFKTVPLLMVSACSSLISQLSVKLLRLHKVQ